MEAYETIGGIFRNLKQNYIEHKLNVKILAIINQIMDFLAKKQMILIFRELHVN